MLKGVCEGLNGVRLQKCYPAPVFFVVERMYKKQRNYENVNKMLFSGYGAYGIPEIQCTQYEHCDWVGFNYANSCNDENTKGVHFFMDDYQFMRLWRYPEKYLLTLQKFKYVMAPDFSTYTDFPVALQIYNHYRKHWLAAYWQEHGINVIPTISWRIHEFTRTHETTAKRNS